jgi:hypothetical protein
MGSRHVFLLFRIIERSGSSRFSQCGIRHAERPKCGIIPITSCCILKDDQEPNQLDGEEEGARAVSVIRYHTQLTDLVRHTKCMDP